jgi:thymidine kinase
LAEVNIEKYQVIGVDEGQFFGDLKDTLLRWMLQSGKKIYVSGLDLDCHGRQFGQCLDLVPYAVSVHKKYAYCVVCKRNNEGVGRVSKALFTIANQPSNDTIKIGNSADYTPVCFEHSIQVDCPLLETSLADCLL